MSTGVDWMEDLLFYWSVLVCFALILFAAMYQ
jgi:hypothetical protein